MIGFKLDQAKTQFFDRAITNGVDKARKRVLSKIGAFVRRTAQFSLRSRKKVSKAGDAPHSHGRKLLRKFIVFVYEPSNDSVIIGPARLNAKIGNAPEALEKGGTSVILTGRRGNRVERKVEIAKRPYMKPAFDKEEPKFLAMWKDSVK